MTPKTPMKSALKVPGTPARLLDPRSPTFNEEVALEKQELSTEKQNARDLVSLAPSTQDKYELTLSTGSKEACPDSKVLPPRCQLLLLPYCSLYA